MKIKKNIILLAIILVVILFSSLYFFKSFKYISKAFFPAKANIYVDTRKIVGPLYFNWKALAQGGEEKGVAMLANVVPQVAALSPRYIRIDHIYDYYDVVERDSQGRLIFKWDQLDATVCDIFRTGAKPFFSLGYMPEVLSGDNSLVSKPKNWNEWSLLVQKTIEHYSGRSTRLCGQVTGDFLSDIYYEVWNEPDLEAFGKWSLYGGEKDYKTLYYYSAQGANRAGDVNHFLLGGPVITAPYENWFRVFLNYILEKNLRLDFLSWHRYSADPDVYFEDLENINAWLSVPHFERFRDVPKIISEWGFDSNPNPISETNAGAAHTITSIRNLIGQKVEMAFIFEVKDGPAPRWGILSYNGEKKARYNAINFLNLLDGYQLKVTGEGTYVRAIASIKGNKITLILVNFDENNSNTELVPVTFSNLTPGNYRLSIRTLNNLEPTVSSFAVGDTQLQRSILMPPNMVAAVELVREE